MENLLSKFVEKAKRAVKFWWLLLLVGIALCAVGIVVFFYPGESYLTISILFGVVMLFSGIVELIMAITEKSYFTGRGWMVVGGIIDILLGIILCANIGISLITLPFILAFWLMYRAIMTIGFGSDLSSFGIKGSGWTIFGGVLLLLLSIVILFRPLLGASMIVAILGISFLAAGISSCYTAFQLKNVHHHVKKLME